MACSLCAVVSVDRTGKREVQVDADTAHIEWFHTDEDKDNFKQLVGRLKLIMGHHLDNELRDFVGWYDYKIVVRCEDFEWDWGKDYADCWFEFWKMCMQLSDERHISGVMVQCGEVEGDLESQEFGAESHYENCHTSQDVYISYVADKRTTD